MGEHQVSALDVTEFTKRVTELVYAHIPCRSMIEDADPCDPTDTFTLLRTRGERPCGGRAAD
jgi:hypothetical protein